MKPFSFGHWDFCVIRRYLDQDGDEITSWNVYYNLKGEHAGEFITSFTMTGYASRDRLIEVAQEAIFGELLALAADKHTGDEQ